MMYKIISIYSKLSNDSREIGNRYYLFDMLIILIMILISVIEI